MTKVYFETFGCSANLADTEQMAGLLKKAEFEITNSQEETDIIILNTCTVKGPTDSKLFKKLEELKDGYKIVIIAGCLAQSQSKHPILKNYPLIGTNQIHKVVEVVEEALNDNVIRELGTNEKPPLSLPVIRTNPLVEIIPISRGCLGFCTFCKTKSARGNLYSYPIAQIINRAKIAIQQNVKEIWLTSQDTGCYGFDINTNLPALLHQLCELKGDFKIRVGMMNPDHLIKIKHELVDIYKHSKIYKFLHLPIQAGNDEVLKNMKRGHKVQDFIEQVELFRSEFPNINIATDVIVGFPGETPEQFFETITLIRRISPDIINISKFWPRPNTPAARMQNKVDGAEIKRRSKVLTEIFHNISRLNNERYINQEMEVLITQKGKKNKEYIARTDNYKQVILSGNLHLGEKIKTKIVKTNTFFLEGQTAEQTSINKNPSENKISLTVY